MVIKFEVAKHHILRNQKKHWDSAIQKTGPGVGFVAQSRPYLAGSYHGET
jgi:hypothetical protein